MSYTIKAAEELRDRLARRLGDLHRRVDADTIHGFALSMLRQHGTRIGLPGEPEVLSRLEDRVEILGSWLADSGKAVPNDLAATIARFDLARASGESAPLLDDWREALTSYGAVDFPAMLDLASELLGDNWLAGYLRRIYGQVVVDEAQNLTRAQYRLLTGIIGTPSAEHLTTMLVGDERQSIVGFAGADRTLMARFASEYTAERIELHTNYRSAELIVDAGRKVARALRQPSEALTNIEFPAMGSVSSDAFEYERDEGQAVANWVSRLLVDGLDPSTMAPGEPTFILPNQIAVLARGSASLRFAKRALTDLGIDTASGSTEDDWVTSTCARVLVEFIAHRSAPDHVTTRRRLSSLCGLPDGTEWSTINELLAAQSNASIAMLREATSAPDPGTALEIAAGLTIDDAEWTVDLAQIQEAWATFIDRVPAAELTFGNFRQHIFRVQRGDTMGDGVRLLTIHKSQGREFKAVAIVACNDGQLPDFRAKNQDQLEEELRAFYVAVSRPSRALFLTRAARRETRTGYWATQASPFLGLIEETNGVGRKHHEWT